MSDRTTPPRTAATASVGERAQLPAIINESKKV